MILLLASVIAANDPHGPSGEDWTRWGGPARTGVTSEAGWNPEGHVLWTRNVGLGYSSVVVRGDELYTLGFDAEAGLDHVVRVNADTGEEEWRHSYPGELMDRAHRGGSLTTPTLDGERLYVSGRQGTLVCLRASDGEVVWSKNPKKELGLEQPTWGFAASPFVDGNLVVMNLGRVVAYDKETGAVVWKSGDDYGHAYSTPMDFTHEGRRCLAVFAGQGLSILDLEKGDELFRREWKTRYDVNAATPLVFGDRIFVSSGYGKGCAMVRIADGRAEELWSSKVMRNHMSGCVPYEDLLFGFDEDVLKCIDLEGNERWRERGLDKGAVTVAGGRLVVMSGDGELVVAEADKEGFSELWREKVIGEGVCWTPPVLSGGRIFCRSQAGQLVCVDHRDEG